MLRVKGWTKFQHYKDRRPPWIKLSRELLENFDWYRLHNDSKALAVTIWLLAAENDDPKAGTIPDDLEWLGFRARMPDKRVVECVKDLVKYGFLEHVKTDESDLLAPCYQDATPETETETENNIYIEGTLQNADTFFEIFWNAYPDVRPKGNKAKAKEKFKALFKQMTKGDLCHETFIRRCKEYKTFCEQGGNYNQHAVTWLNQEGWGTDWASQTRAAPDKPRAGNRQHQAAGGLDKIIDTGEKAKEMLRRQTAQDG